MASKTSSFTDPDPEVSDSDVTVDSADLSVTLHQPEPEAEKVDAEFKDVTFYNPHAGLTGRDGGPYLDQVERYAAETNRARAENRKPDYETATFTAGVPAYTGRQMRGVQDVLSHPSMLVDAHDGSTNDGAEVLPVNVNTSEFLNDHSEAGHYVKGGEDASTEGATVVSPLRKS